MRDAFEQIAAAVPGAFAGVEVLRTTLRREGRTHVLSLIVDRDGGMDTDACGRISRFIIERIDVLDPPIDDYRIEVSSAGLDRPLLTPEHYRRFRGRPAKIVTSLRIGNRVEFNGPIGTVSDEAVTIVDPHAGATPIPFEAIKRAHLIYDPSSDLKRKR
jgi:ribosome maturation factor RimP